ncbi:hypothetical protein Salat_2979600, partial [Sesamum alatum]
MEILGREKRHSTSIKQHQEQSHTMPSSGETSDDAMNAALEDVYKKEEFQPLLPLGRVSLLSELAGRGDQLINMNLESGWLIAASLSWRLSGRGGACYRNLFLPVG